MVKKLLKSLLGVCAVIIGLTANMTSISAQNYIWVNDSDHRILSLIYETQAEEASRKEWSPVPLKYQSNNQILQEAGWDSYYEKDVYIDGYGYENHCRWPMLPGHWCDGSRGYGGNYHIIALLDNGSVIKTPYFNVADDATNVYYFTNNGVRTIHINSQQSAEAYVAEITNILRSVTHTVDPNRPESDIYGKAATATYTIW